MMPTPLNDQGKDAPNVFKHSITEHRAKVASLKAVGSPAEVYCKELLIPLQSDAQLPIRIYRPKTDIPLPTFFYVPGTAFVAWETAFTHIICSHIAEKANCQVIAIYHRLAPENMFPAGYKDAYRILKAILQAPSDAFKLDRHNIALGGYSSGGNLAALMAIRAKEAKLPIHYQALISPMVDLSRSLTDFEKFKQLRECENQDKVISPEFVNWFINLYVSDNFKPSNPAISPFWQSNTRIKGLPPTDIIFGEYDRFRSDAEAYTEKLRAEDVSVERIIFQGEDHSFLWYKMEVIETIAARLKFFFSNYSIPKSMPYENHRIIVIKAENPVQNNHEDTPTLLQSKL